MNLRKPNPDDYQLLPSDYDLKNPIHQDYHDSSKKISSEQLKRTIRDVLVGFLIATVCWSIPSVVRFSLPLSNHHSAHQDHHHHKHHRHHHKSSWFPSGPEIGYQGLIKTGVEPFAAVEAIDSPQLESYFPLVSPAQTEFNHSFNPIRSWGYLSPFHSLAPNAFGLDGCSAKVPKGCKLKQVHLLHRHGARYPTKSNGPIQFSQNLKAAKGYKASGDLDFLNDWKYGLGMEILTPFGRNQLFNLGVGFRQKYGHLLNKLGKSKKLVFRTTSQHRMLHSALNFAAGFFGLPYESQYHQSILIEAKGFNNSLAPYFTCKNNQHASKTFVSKILADWSEIYLAEALPRLQANLTGYQLSFKDVVSMQQLCAYETVSLGWSPFCKLFTSEEFKGFAYYSDLLFWYGYSFGSPTAAAVGKGWVEELVSRLTKKPIKRYDSSTNSTLNSNPITFPLDQPIYVDATHDTIISSVVVALNLTALASEGPPPTRFIPKKQSFVSAHIVPFSANLQTQIVKCDGEEKIRFLLNDAPVPLTGLRGCPEDREGFCPVETAVQALQARLKDIDFYHDCNAQDDYEPPFGGGGIVNGRPPL
ncbi:hypothetical protein O181_066542 [Austropuccinia psidii MF-1]|uniref:Phosphoglycerate mutase-like protein n=1 Tax=Austropuccinia psidii MF-1 TaxID=1389203 RepID=A0A9Q3I4E2_9BASI|nr:hypothetical protein [Austropuccinia psidii MF-1]